jgi:hypothetical protein
MMAARPLLSQRPAATQAGFLDPNYYPVASHSSAYTEHAALYVSSAG